MTVSSNKIDVYLEIGQKRTLAGAVDWPGWCRAGRGEAGALQALFDAGPRYASILHAAQIEFQPPADVSDLVVVERLEGTTTTDFGAPDVALASDSRPIEDDELQRFLSLLQAYWQAFDRTVDAAWGKELRKGPRGGGRSLEKIVRHVLESDAAYVARLAWKFKPDEMGDLDQELNRTRQAVVNALTAAAHGELPERGPRGGALWIPRYFVRRLAWHVLDHVWEIEDRVI